MLTANFDLLVLDVLARNGKFHWRIGGGDG